MRRFRYILLLASLSFSLMIYSVNSSDDRVFEDSIVVKTRRFIPQTLGNLADLSVRHSKSDQLISKELVSFSSFNLSQHPFNIDMHKKSQMSLKVVRQKQFLFFDRWSFEFKKYVHGPKFAFIKLGISI